MKPIFLITILILCFACTAPKITDDLPTKTNPNLNYFGFTLIDTYWDDPTDSDHEINFVSEVGDFTNLGDILPANHEEDLKPRLEYFESFGVSATIHEWHLIFEEKEQGGELSGVIYQLREDFQERWDEFNEINKFNENSAMIHSFYLGEEPAWNGISEEEFTEAADYIKSQNPDIPILLIEAHPVIDQMYNPPSVDYIGWNRYFVKEPISDDNFTSDLAIIKEKRLENQLIYLIMDAHYIPKIHGIKGISKKRMANIAREYYEMADADSNIGGILAYHWPSGFDFKSTKGARHLPEEVMEQYEMIGKEISGK